MFGAMGLVVVEEVEGEILVGGGMGRCCSSRVEDSIFAPKGRVHEGSLLLLLL